MYASFLLCAAGLPHLHGLVTLWCMSSLQAAVGACSPLMPASDAAQTARLYDAGRRMLRGSYSQVAPALDGAFQDDSVVYVGGLDGLVRRRARCC